MITGETETNKLPPLELSLLGGFSIRVAEQVIALETPSHQSLLAYLVIHADQAQTRQHLAFLLWPESTETQARTNLRKATYVLRRTLPSADCYLQVNRQTLCWHPTRPVAVDVLDFLAAVARAQEAHDDSSRMAAQEEIVRAYHGALLPGHYADWILAKREEWRARYLDALEDLVVASESRREYPAAIRHARSLLRADPLHETTYRRLMRLHALAGNLAGALQVYHTCVTRLKQDLDVVPSIATQATYEQLLQRKAAVGVTSTARVPLVGREAAWQTLQRAWQKARHGPPTVIFVHGDAGIGKTRLAEEMLDWAERQGIAVLAAACYRAEQQLAYAPLARWLRTEAMHRQLVRSPTRLQSECSRLLPELLAQYPTLPEPRPLTESWQRQHFFSALAQVVLPPCRPGLLFIDDLPWSDCDTLEWLQFLLRYESPARFLLLVTARSEELTPDHPLLAWQQQLAQDGRLTTLALTGLDQQQTTRLAGHLIKEGLDAQQAAHLYAETEGNPLFVVEMARTGRYSPGAGSERGTLPPRMQSVIEGRLAALTPAAYELAQLAATIGRSFGYPLLERACTQDGRELVHSLDELWHRRILREQGMEAYDFSHDKIRQVAYASLSNARRRQTHFRVAKALEGIHANNLDTVSGQIADHYTAAGEYGPAIAHYQRAAAAAQAVYAHHDVLSHLRRAVALFERTEVDAVRQVEVYAFLAKTLRTMGEFVEAEEALQTALIGAPGPFEAARLNRQLGQLWTQKREFAAAEQAFDQAEQALGERHAGQEQTWWQEWLQIQLERAFFYYWSNRDKDLLQLTETLLARFEAHGSPAQVGRFYQILAMYSFRRHRYVVPSETISYLQASLAAINETGDPNQIAFAHFALGFAYLLLGWRGDLDHAEVALQSALDLAEEVGDPVVQCRSRTYLCVVYRKRGETERLRKQATRALALAEQMRMPEYIACALGQLAWVALQEGDLARAQELGERAAVEGEAYPVPIPIKWPYLWPLIAVKLANGDPTGALTYAQLMLAPTHQRLPAEIAAKLELALAAGDEDRPEALHRHLEEALQLAQDHLYL